MVPPHLNKKFLYCIECVTSQRKYLVQSWASAVVDFARVMSYVSTAVNIHKTAYTSLVWSKMYDKMKIKVWKLWNEDMCIYKLLRLVVPA